MSTGRPQDQGGSCGEPAAKRHCPEAGCDAAGLRPAALSADEKAQFQRDGFIVIRDYFGVERDLRPVMRGIEKKVDRLARELYEAGKIKDMHEGAGLYERLALLEKEFPGAAVLIHIEGDLDQATKDLWTNPRLLELAHAELGPDVAGHPVWNLRSKTPSTALTTVPWHQDIAYLTPGAEATEQLTAWIPLLDVTAKHGPMTFIRGGHKGRPLLPHHLEKSRKGKTSHSQTDGDSSSWYVFIKDDDLPKGEMVRCEMKLGDLLLLGNIIPHCTSENTTSEVRWSLDLRWQRPKEFSGFETLKPCVLMREGGKEPAGGIDWDAFCTVNRTKVQQESDVTWCNIQGADVKVGRDFYPDVKGPWMKRWAPAS